MTRHFGFPLLSFGRECPELDDDDVMNDNSPPEHQIDPNAPAMSCDYGDLNESCHAPAPELPPASNPLFLPAQDTQLPGPDIDPPSFNEFLRSSDPLKRISSA